MLTGMRIRLFSYLLLLLPALLSAGREVVFAPSPSWVLSQRYSSEPADRSGSESSGINNLLLEQQYDLASQTFYERTVQSIVTTAALQNVTKLTFSFDPSYQTLTLHTVHAVRNGTIIPLLDRSRLQVIQQEEGLEADLYDGRLTAVLLLNDLRVGDVLEFSVSITGWNPIFRNKFNDDLQFNWPVPVGSYYYRVLVPEGRTLNISYHGKEHPPAVQRTGEGTEYIWKGEKVKPLHPEDDLPYWYFPFDWAQITEYESWKEVAQWAVTLFDLPQSEIEALRPKIDELKKRSSSRQDYVRAALRFVQDDIRYFGIEMGINSHQPNPPRKVFRQRFGDCKDKTLLLCALLRGNGIQAVPALVNTGLGYEIEKFHPSPRLFNHVVVHLPEWNKTLDPTLTQQRGLFTLLTFPYELKGLLVTPGTTELTDLNDHSNDQSRSEVQETFSIRTLFGPVLLKASSTYYGNKANVMRQYFNDMTPLEREQFGNRYYANEYYKVTTASPLKISLDDEQTNILVLTEEYIIDSLWKRNDEEGRMEANFFATSMRERFDIPAGAERTMPLAAKHPASIIYKTRIELPEDWLSEPFDMTVSDPAFTFTKRERFSERRVELEYSFLSHKDHVPPDQVRSYADHVGEAQASIGFALYKYDEGNPMQAGKTAAAGTVWWFPTVMWLGFFGAIVLGVHAWKWSAPVPLPPVTAEQTEGEGSAVPMPALTELMTEQYVGIKGFLLLPAIQLCLYPLVSLFQIFVNHYPVYARGVWDRLTTPGGESYHPALGPILLMELTVAVLLMLFTLLAGIYFFRKKKEAPVLMLWWYGCISAYPVIDTLLVASYDIPFIQKDGIDIKIIVQSALNAGIWIPYFLNSERVESTFNQ